VGRDQAVQLLALLHRIEAEERRLLELRRRANADSNDRIELYNYVVAVVGGLLMVFLIAAMVGASRAHRRSLDMGESLHRLATTDALTGLPNRRQLMAALEMETSRARRTGRPLAIALLDVDRFKSVNDTHGHAAGDEVLRVVARELRRVTRGGDLLGRYGGEEFAIWMPETELAEACGACERLRAAIARRTIHFPDGTVGRVTVSAGVALLAGGEETARFIARADAALYEAKTGGRNLVRLAA
jgi:diguanylate cyclase (GGDEF)-like protein